MSTLCIMELVANSVVLSICVIRWTTLYFFKHWHAFKLMNLKILLHSCVKMVKIGWQTLTSHKYNKWQNKVSSSAHQHLNFFLNPNVCYFFRLISKEIYNNCVIISELKLCCYAQISNFWNLIKSWRHLKDTFLPSLVISFHIWFTEV